MKERKEFKNKGFVIVLLFTIFALPCISSAISISNIDSGYVNTTPDNTLKKMSFDDSGSDVSLNHRPRHKGEGQPQAAPIPSAVWLLGTGLVGLFAIRRKMNK
jgi:hypothetical protein